MNRFLQETDILEWMTKWKTILIQKTPKNEPPRQIQTNNMPTDDLENTKGRYLGKDLRYANKLRTVSRATERMPRVDQR